VMRKITIGLAEDTTSKRCGSCPHMSVLGMCAVFKDALNGRPKNRVRLQACIAAENATHPDSTDDVPHKAASDATIARLRTMSRNELLATFVDAGIVDENGKLTEAYRPVEPDAGRCERCGGLGRIEKHDYLYPCTACNGTGRKTR